MTLRDAVWDAVLKRLAEEGPFRKEDLGFPEGSKHTVRRILKEMEKLEWLARESRGDDVWEAGDRARRYFESVFEE